MTRTTTNDVVSLVSDLVRIDSVTPWLVPGGAGETEVARYIADWLADLPVEVVIDEIEPGRVNLVATLRGTGGGPTLCLNAHADTVGYGNWRDEALVPRLDGDRMYGLGTADDKGCCAAALLALRELAARPSELRGDLVVACVADEEGISIGTEHLLKTLRADAAVVLEPDALPRVIVEHQGFGWIDVVTIGKPAHGSAPDEGVDSIVAMAEVVSRLHRLDVESFAAAPDPRNGRTVFHTGTIQGGTDYATYPATCALGIEIGTQTNETLADRVAEIESILADVRSAMPGLETKVHVALDRQPFLAAGHERVLGCFDAAAREHLGHDLTQGGLNAWTDAAMMQDAGIRPSCSGRSAATSTPRGEWVSVPEVAVVADIVTTAAREFLA